MEVIELDPSAAAIERNATEWVQSVLDVKLNLPAEDEKLLQLMVGAAMLLNTVAQLGRIPPEDVRKLVENYRTRLTVIQKQEPIDATG